MYKLEDRVLLDAALPVDVADAVEPAEEQLPPEADSSDDIVENDSAATENDSPQDEAEQQVEFTLPGLADLAESSFAENSLVIIDTSVSDYQTLIDALEGTADIELIDSSKGGVKQISDILSRYDNLDSLHILSEGGEGHLVLGNDVLWNSNIDSFSDNLSLWSNALSADADILFYGCSTASSERGVELLSSIADLTGADVAGSIDMTGAAEQGGDWDLEFNSGIVESQEIGVSGYADTFATFTVTNTNDSGVGSLRDAVADANGSGGADIIVFDPGAFSAENTTITLTGTDISITESLTILGDVDGDDDIDITIDANSNSRHFYINGGQTVELNFLKLTNGSVTNERGGSIYNVGGILTVQSCEISSSSVTNSTGGAIAQVNVGSVLNIYDSTIYGNQSSAEGGALYIDAGNMTMLRSTISGNTSSGSMVIDLNGGGNFSIKYSTITNNTGTYGVDVNNSTLSVYSSIIAGNNCTDDVKILGGGDSFNYSWIGSEDGATISQVGPEWNIIDDSLASLAGIQALADNGGPTLTHALTFESVAKDAGNTDGADAVVDQRGINVSGTRDIGAYEVSGTQVKPTNYSLTVTTLLDTGDDAHIALDYNDDVTDGGGLSLREAIFWGQYGSSSTVSFDSSLAGGTMTLSSGIVLSYDVSITGLDSNGDGVGDITITGSDSHQIFNLSDGDGGAADVISISNLILTNGSAANGGAISTTGVNLTLNNVQIKSSVATGVGGGLYVNGGTISLNKSSVYGNHAQGSIGFDGWNFSGGGLYLAAGSLSIDQSAIYDNRGLDNGGGIAALNATALNITNSTIASNSIDGQWGAGITVYGVDVTLDHVTIADNTGGGGIGVLTKNGDLTASNIIAVRHVGVDIEFNGTGSGSMVYSWVESTVRVTQGAGVVAGGDTSTLENDIAVNGANGGPVKSLAITNTSPAYNTASTSSGNDQRGVAAQGVRDMGAYELDTTAPSLSGTTPLHDATVEVSNSKVITITFDESIDPATGSVTLTDMGDVTATDETVTINLSDSRIVVSGSTLTLTLASELTAGERYQITTTGITDIAQNAAPAIGAGTVVYSVVADPVPESESGSDLTNEQIEGASGSTESKPKEQVSTGVEVVEPTLEPSWSFNSSTDSLTIYIEDPLLSHYVEPDIEVFHSHELLGARFNDDLPSFSLIQSVISDWQTKERTQFSPEEAQQFFDEFDRMFKTNDPFDWGNEEDERRRQDINNSEVNPSIIFHEPQMKSEGFMSPLQRSLAVLSTSGIG